MNIALISKNTGICTNIAVFENLKAAQQMFKFQDILEVTEVVEGFWIGDIYKDGIWSKKITLSQEELPEQNRQTSYKAMRYKADESPLISWREEALTVNEANEKWLYYSAEGSDLANELSVLIVMAKEYIREIYPDNE